MDEKAFASAAEVGAFALFDGAPADTPSDPIALQDLPDAELVRRRVARVVVMRDRLIVHLRAADADAGQTRDSQAHEGQAHEGGANDSNEAASGEMLAPLVLSFVPRGRKRKGVAHAPSDDAPTLEPSAREALLKTIARSRRWVSAILSGEAAFDAIAAQENLAVRHVRRLAPLAFLAPAVVEAIVDGAVPAGLTATGLAEALPLSWDEQKRRLEAS